jgi:hypothetical protein
MSTNTKQQQKPKDPHKSVVKDILMFVLAVNWILGGITIALTFKRMQSDFKLLVMTFLFGLFGYVSYVND